MASSVASTVSRYTRSSLLFVGLALGGLLSRHYLLHSHAMTQPSITPRMSTAAAVQLPFYSTADFTAEWIAKDDARYASIHRIAPFAFTNQLGEVVTNDTLKGKIYVANFFFASCHGICPKMLGNLRRIQAAYHDDPNVLLLSHSVMPAVDSVELLRAYAEQNGIEAGKWHLLTGDAKVIFQLARQSYFAEKTLGKNKRADEFVHTENMLLIDGQGRIRGVYNATLQTDAERLIEEIRQLKSE